MVHGLPFAHIPSRFAADRRRGHDIDAVNLGQVRTGHEKQVRAQAELWRIPLLLLLLLLEPILPLLRWQTGTLTPVLSLLEILLKPPITFGHLLLAKLVTILFLLQYKDDSPC